MKKILLLGVIGLCWTLSTQAQTCFDMSTMPTSGNDYRFGIKDGSTDPKKYGWVSSLPTDWNERRKVMSSTDPAKDTLFTSLDVLPSGKANSIRLASPDYVTFQMNDSAKGGDVRFPYAVTADNAILQVSYAAGLEEPEDATFAGNFPRYGQPWCSIYVLDENGALMNTKAIEHYPSKSNTIVGWSSVTTSRGYNAYVKDWSMVGMDLTDKIGKTVTVVISYHDGAASGFDNSTNTLTICRDKRRAHVYAYLECAKKEITLDCETSKLTAPDGFTYAWSKDGSAIGGATSREYTLDATRTENAKYSCELKNDTGCLSEDFVIDTMIYANYTTKTETIRELQLPWMSPINNPITRDSIDWAARNYLKDYVNKNLNGCDSTLAYTLNILKTETYYEDTTVCSDMLPGYVWKGKTWDVAGVQYDTLVAAAGGDSIITWELKTKDCSCEEFKGTLELDNPICANAQGLRSWLRAAQGMPASFSVKFHDQDPKGHFQDLYDQALAGVKEQEVFIPFSTGRIQPNTFVRMTTL